MADLSKFNVNNIEYNIKDAYAREQLTNLISLNDIVDKELVKFYFPDLSGGGYSGNCSLVVTPFKTILMDCGPTSDWTAIHSYLNNLYTKEIFSNIDIIIISHYHYDHVENLSNILSSFPHDNCVVYLPLNPTNYNNIPSEVLTQRSNVLNILNTNNVNYVEVSQDTLLQFNDSYIKIKLINSSYADYSYYSNLPEPAVYNNYSMVALIQIGEVYAMFPGDIQRDAQIRIFNQHELPRLFLYCVHHHGIQNDDYIPYLETIQPEYSVIMTSHNRALLSAASSYSGNYFSDFVGSTGFSSYEFVCGQNGGTIVYGLNIPRIGWYYSYVDLYVDNEYNGAIHDGTQEHPFLEINEALMFVKQESNLHYYIRVKGTNTIYDYMWAREFKVPIDILGYKDSSGANVYPSVKGGYIRACTCVNIANLIFNGTGREINTHPTIFYVWSGKVSLVNCTLDGSNLSLGTNRYLLQLRESHAYLNGCNFNNSDVGVVSYREGEVTTNIVNFNNVTYCYNVSNLSLYIRGLDTISNVTYWLSGGGRAVSINNVSNINDTLLAKIYKAVVSQPFYCNDTYPMCMIQGTKIYVIVRTEKDAENSNIYVTPEMYGAVGNGVNDDSSAIQNAIDTGKTVLFAKEKTYAIAEPITINKSIVIEEGCTIKAIVSMNALFEISGATSDTFRFIGGTLDCNNLADYGIYTTSLTGAYIQNVRVLNSATANIYLGSGNHNWIVNCKLYNQQTLMTGIYNNTNDLKVIDCEIYYTSLAIDQRKKILMVSNSHFWSGGATNESTTSMAIKVSSLSNGVLAEMFLSNVYFDSFYKCIYTSGITAHIKASSCLFHWASTTTPQSCYGLDVPANSIYKLSSCMFYSDGIDIVDILYDGYSLAYTEPQTSVASKFSTPQATQTIFNAHVKDGLLHLDFVLKMTSVTADSSTQIPIIVSEGNFPYWIVQRADGVAYNNTQNTPVPIRLSRSSSTGVITLHCAEGIAVDDIIQGSIIAPLRG